MISVYSSLPGAAKKINNHGPQCVPEWPEAHTSDAFPDKNI